MQSTATVCHCFGGYVLPEGLTEGEIVKLVDFDRGTYTVLCQDGRTFQIDGPSVVAVPSEFYANHRAEAFLKRMRSLFRSPHHDSGLAIRAQFNYVRFTVFGDDRKPRGSLAPIQ